MTLGLHKILPLPMLHSVWQIGLYKIVVHLFVCVQESIIP